jgi:hypothetical protein
MAFIYFVFKHNGAVSCFKCVVSRNPPQQSWRIIRAVCQNCQCLGQQSIQTSFDYEARIAVTQLACSVIPVLYNYSNYCNTCSVYVVMWLWKPWPFLSPDIRLIEVSTEGKVSVCLPENATLFLKSSTNTNLIYSLFFSLNWTKAGIYAITMLFVCIPPPIST